MPQSWTGITEDNRIILDTELNEATKDGYFLPSTNVTIPIQNKGVTKDRVLQYLTGIDVSQNNVHLYPKTSPQLVAKRDLINIKNCSQCRSYNVYVDPADIDLSTNNGGNGTIYIYFYPCGTTGGTMSYQTFQTPGFHFSTICIQNCASVEPYLYYDYDGGSSPMNSKIFELAGDCSVSQPIQHNCNTTFTTTINSSGKISLQDSVVLNDNYGNFTVTISGSQQNDIAEVFVGNYQEGYGEVISLSKGNNNIQKSVGYYNSNGGNIVDIVVYSSSTTAFQPYTLSFNFTCLDTVTCQSTLPSTQTYVSGTTLNVTQSGVIQYNTSDLNSVTQTVPVGNVSLLGCYIYETLKAPLVVTNPAVYTVTYSGSSCNSGSSGSSGSSGGGCVEITFSANQGFSATAWWIDCYGTQKTQFVSVGQSLTVCGIQGSASGLPLTYGNICAY